MAELNNPDPVGGDPSAEEGSRVITVRSAFLPNLAMYHNLQLHHGRLFTQAMQWCRNLTLLQRTAYFIAPPFTVAIIAFSISIGCYFSYRDYYMSENFFETEGMKRVVTDPLLSSNTASLYKCMRYCLDKHGCIDGFHDPALSKDNCFLFGAPPFYFGHTPIPSPTATTFIKKSKMELRGVQIELAKEDSLYYHMSTDVVRYADMEDYCRHENDLYYPAIMGLNNSAYDVARRYSYRLRRGDHPRRNQGLLFLMAIGYPDSHAQYDLARGYAFVGKDSSNRQRLLRFVFYDNGMLEFLSDVFKKRQFFVLCQADPLNLRGDNLIQRTLFHVPTVRGKSLS